MANLTTLSIGYDYFSQSTPLISDTNGDLFGTTSEGGAGTLGSVCEIADTAGSYASTPTTLFSFNEDGSGYGPFPNGFPHSRADR